MKKRRKERERFCGEFEVVGGGAVLMAKKAIP